MEVDLKCFVGGVECAFEVWMDGDGNQKVWKVQLVFKKNLKKYIKKLKFY